MYVLFDHNYRVVTLSTLYLTVLDIIILMLKLIRQSKLINQKVKIVMLKKIDILIFFVNDYRVAMLSTFYLTVTGIIIPS